MRYRKIDAMHEEYGLSPEGRCGECCNLERKRYNCRNYIKCAAYGVTHSEATDWRAGFIACGLLNRPFDGLKPSRRPLIEVLGRGHQEITAPGQTSMFESGALAATAVGTGVITDVDYVADYLAAEGIYVEIRRGDDG